MLRLYVYVYFLLCSLVYFQKVLNDRIVPLNANGTPEMFLSRFLLEEPRAGRCRGERRAKVRAGKKDARGAPDALERQACYGLADRSVEGSQGTRSRLGCCPGPGIELAPTQMALR